MNINDREMALRAICWCDQIEEALKRGNHIMLEKGREYIQAYASDLSEEDVVVFVQCIRARAQEILREGAGE